MPSILNIPNNVFANESLISKRVLLEFHNSLVMAKKINRDHQNVFNNNTGTTIEIREPTRFTVTSNVDITSDIQDIRQRVVPLVIDQRQIVAISLSSQQIALNLDDFARTVLRPAMLQLANKVDQTIYDTSLGIYNFTGTAGTPPNSSQVINSARTKLTALGVPTDPRYLMLSVNDGGSVADGLASQFNYQKLNQEILDDGIIANLSGFNMYEVQNNKTSLRSSIPDGTSIGTPVVAVTSVSGATTLQVSGLTASTLSILKKGAVFSIAGVGSVNEVTRSPTGLPMNFTLTADADSDVSGNSTLQIAPQIIFDGGPYVNVTALPTSGAALTVQGSHTVNIAYHPEAFTLAMINLPSFNQQGVEMKTMIDSDAKISIRMAKQYDIKTDQLIVRFEVLYGVKCFPNYATRIMGSFNKV